MLVTLQPGEIGAVIIFKLVEGIQLNKGMNQAQIFVKGGKVNINYMKLEVFRSTTTPE